MSSEEGEWKKDGGSCNVRFYASIGRKSGTEIFKFPSGPKTPQIRDSEGYFYAARTNLEKLSGTMKNPGE